MLSTGVTCTLEPPMVGAEQAMPWFLQAVLFAIFVVPVILLFGYAMLDVIRRPGMGVSGRALWLIGFCILPIIGPLGLPRHQPAGFAGDGGAPRRWREQPRGGAVVPGEPARPGQADGRGVPAGEGPASEQWNARVGT